VHIEVKDSTVEVKSGVSARTQKNYEIHEQTAYLVTPDERKRIVLSLRNGQQPYAIGRYVISPESFTVSNFGALTIGRLVLSPAVPSKAA